MSTDSTLLGVLAKTTADVGFGRKDHHSQLRLFAVLFGSRWVLIPRVAGLGLGVYDLVVPCRHSGFSSLVHSGTALFPWKLSASCDS